MTIQIEPGAKSSTGANRNGTTTESSGPSTGSFVFIGQPIYKTDVGYGGRGWDAYPSSFPAKNGQRYLYICPPRAAPKRSLAPAPTPPTAPSAPPQSKKG